MLQEIETEWFCKGYKSIESDINLSEELDARGLFGLSLPRFVYLEFNPLNFGANTVLAVLGYRGCF